MTDLRARPVEKVAPQPKRPEPVPPASKKPDAAVVPVKVTPPKIDPKSSENLMPPAPVTRLPTTGREVTAGSAPSETGSKGESPGLAQGGGGTGNAVPLDVVDFCCMAYVTEIATAIEEIIDWAAGDRGVTIVKFRLKRDGTLVGLEFEQRGPQINSLMAQSAIRSASKGFKPLPEAFKGDTLTIKMTFPFKMK